MALQVSAGSGTSPHSHTAAQVIVALSGQLQVRMSPKVLILLAMLSSFRPTLIITSLVRVPLK